MLSTLAETLDAARSHHMIGRHAERALLRSALEAPELPFCLLFVFGPGGIGKTTLLHAFAAEARAHNVTPIWLDAREVEPTPSAFLNALHLALDIPPEADLYTTLRTRSTRNLLLIDTYEIVQELDGWIRNSFLPNLPPNLLIVLSGRHSPDAGWRVDAGWRSVVRMLPLRNLNPDESRDYLTHRDIPVEQFRSILDFTHGHPLALSLVADLFAQRPSLHFTPETAPDVIQPLLTRFLENIPDRIPRQALEICALVHQMTEPLLAAMLEVEDAHTPFQWLQNLSFVETGAQGLVLHDVVRETLLADLRWRSPDRYIELHHRARAYYAARLQETRGREQQRLLYDFIFLHRDNPIVRSSFLWQDSPVAFADTLRSQDRPALLAMTTRHEGAESARLLDYWLEQPHQKTLVFRNSSVQSEPLGFMMLIALHQITGQDRATDPALDTALRHLEQNVPLRPGEQGVYFRFWMAHDTYQSLSHLVSQMVVTVVRHDLTTPNLAYTLFPCADPDFWSLAFEYAEKRRVPDADFEVGGRRYGVFAHDWRTLPPTVWLARLADKELGGEILLETPTAPPPPVVLSRPDFEVAVKQALTHFMDADGLRGNPLLRSRMVLERVREEATPAEQVQMLCRLIREAADALQSSPKLARGYRVLLPTYLEPYGTQEQVAARLDLPFSTYRRHLGEGITHLTEALWNKEIDQFGK